MPPEAGQPGPRGLALIVQSGAFDQVHYALAMAAAAAAVGRPVTLFFTMAALGALTAEQGWRGLATSDGRPAAAADALYGERGIADFESLIAACADLDVRVIACEMGLRALGLARGALRQDLEIEDAGLATLLLEAAGADLVYI